MAEIVCAKKDVEDLDSRKPIVADGEAGRIYTDIEEGGELVDKDAALLCSDPLFRKTDREHVESKIPVSISGRTRVGRSAGYSRA
jgi:hypothetical protein